MTGLPWPLVAASVCAVDLRSGRRHEVDPERAWPLASVAKLPWALALHRSAALGDIDLRGRVILDPATRTPGPTGVGALSDPVEVSLRDAAVLALTLSDNACADAVFDALGARRLVAELAAVGLPASFARGPMRDLFAAVEAQVGPDPSAEAALTAALAGGGPVGVLDPERVTSGSVADLARVLLGLWRDEAADPTSCAHLRRVLARAPSSRFAPAVGDDVEVASKTGTLLTLRHEAGVVTYPDGRSVALAVLTEAADVTHPGAHDEAVGALARRALSALAG